MKNLYLVKMGGNYENKGEMEGSDVGNYRIRGTFHNSNGDLIFIEFGNGMQWKNKKCVSRIQLRIDSQYNKTISDDENKSHIKIDYEELKSYRYTKEDILKYIYKNFGVKFDNLKLIDSCITNYDYNKIAGDEFVPDEKAIKQAEKIRDYFTNFEKEIEGKKYPNFSIYYENNNLIVLKHYNGFNDKIIIENLNNFNFNYEIPKKCESIYKFRRII